MLAQILAEVAHSYRPSAGMIAAQVLPPLTVTQRHTEYWRYSRTASEPFKKHSVSLYEYALECRPAPQEEIDALKRKVRMCFDKIYLDYELRVSNMLRDPENYPIEHHVTVAGVAQWSEQNYGYGLGDPDGPPFLNTINRGVDAIRNHTGGLVPNTIILGSRAADAFRNWVARTPDDAYDDKPGLLHPKHLRILEGTVSFSTDPSNGMEWVWGNDAILAYIAPAPAIDQITLGATLRLPDAEYVKVLPSDTDDIDIIEAVRAGITGQQEVLIAPDCGFLIRNVVAR